MGNAQIRRTAVTKVDMSCELSQRRSSVPKSVAILEKARAAVKAHGSRAAVIKCVERSRGPPEAMYGVVLGGF